MVQGHRASQGREPLLILAWQARGGCSHQALSRYCPLVSAEASVERQCQPQGSVWRELGGIPPNLTSTLQSPDSDFCWCEPSWNQQGREQMMQSMKTRLLSRVGWRKVGIASRCKINVSSTTFSLRKVNCMPLGMNIV